MKCPRCNSDKWVGVLHTIRRRDAVLETCFCKDCCIEFISRNDKVVDVYRVLVNGRIQKIS